MKGNRSTIALAILILYLIPILSLSVFTLSSGWILFSCGLTMAFGGSVFLYSLICNGSRPLERNDEKITPVVVKDHDAESLKLASTQLQKKQSELMSEIEIKNQDLRKAQQDQEKSQKQLERVLEELNITKNSIKEQLKERDDSIAEFYATVKQLKDDVESQKQIIKQLEGREQELLFEIKTLLQVTSMENEEESLLTDEPFFPKVRTFTEAQQKPLMEFLRNCVQVASKMTGMASSIGNTRSLPAENYVLDLRRLCDSLKMETPYLTMVYSLKESKVVFANNQAQKLLEWPSDKFVQIFPEIIQESSQEWRQQLQQIGMQQESCFSIALKAKNGSKVNLECCLGAIPNGIFRNHVIAVFGY